MTTHHLEPGLSGPPTAGPTPDDGAFGALFESSPARVVPMDKILRT